MATNEFRDFDNIVIVGQFTYPQSAYLGLALAASGQPIDPTNLPDTTGVRAGELCHHLLQGHCRASVRKASGVIAGACNAYVITNMGDLERVFAEVFPGCLVTAWKDSELPTDGLIGRAIAYLIDRFDGQDLEAIRKSELAKALRTTTGSLANTVFRKSALADFVDEIGLELGTRTVKRSPCGFSGIGDGYVHPADN